MYYIVFNFLFRERHLELNVKFREIKVLINKFARLKISRV